MMPSVLRCFLPALDPRLSTVQIRDRFAQDFNHKVVIQARWGEVFVDFFIFFPSIFDNLGMDRFYQLADYKKC